MLGAKQSKWKIPWERPLFQFSKPRDKLNTTGKNQKTAEVKHPSPKLLQVIKWIQ